MDEHGWSRYFTVDLLDAEGPDMQLDIPNGKVIKKDFVGKDLKNYDSMLVLSHFKGHPMGGYGGALKQLSIGVASSYGKAYIHGAGVPENLWTADHDSFLESMADADKSIVDYFGEKIVFINVMKNPILLSILIALPFALLNLHFPSFVNKAIGSVANTATPLALISIGASFEGKKALKKMKPTLLASFIKLILLAGLFLPLAVFFGYRNQELMALLVMLGSPTTVSSYIMAKNTGMAY